MPLLHVSLQESWNTLQNRYFDSRIRSLQAGFHTFEILGIRRTFLKVDRAYYSSFVYMMIIGVAFVGYRKCHSTRFEVVGASLVRQNKSRAKFGRECVALIFHSSYVSRSGGGTIHSHICNAAFQCQALEKYQYMKLLSPRQATSRASSIVHRDLKLTIPHCK